MADLSTITVNHLTNKAYGFPVRGAARRIRPKVLACIHITDNPNNQGSNAALNERNYANRTGSGGPSAHFYLNRDGSGIEAIDPQRYAAWSNGDVKSPNLANKGTAYCVSLTKSGYNANEGCWLEIENVGYDKVAGQITAQQIDTMGRLIAKQSLLTGIHIGRDTIIPHAYINTVDRPHCPAINIDAVMNQIVAAANSYLLPKTFAITWTATPPAQRTTTVVWTPLGFQITKS